MSDEKVTTHAEPATPRARSRGWSLERVLATLDLRAERDGVFTADSLEIVTGRIFGGQVLAQVVVGAAAAVPAKQVKSVYVQFARDGVAPDPVRIDVAVLHDGGTYSTCDVRVSQEGRVLADATVSLHVPGRGPAQQSVAMHATDPDAATPMELGAIPCETRVVDDVDLADDAVGPAEFAFWIAAPTSTRRSPCTRRSSRSRPISRRSARRCAHSRTCRSATPTAPSRPRPRATRCGSTTTSTSPSGCCSSRPRR